MNKFLRNIGGALKDFIKKDTKRNLTIVLIFILSLYLCSSFLIAKALTIKLAFILCGVGFTYGAFIMFLTKEPKETNNLGDSRLAEVEALKGLTGNDGLLLSKNVQLSAQSSCEHVAIIGPTGSGKSSTYFIPNLLNLDPNASIIITDPKGELYRKTRKYNESIGRQCLVFSPLDPSNSVPYNPLDLAEDITEIREIAQAILMNGANAVALATGKTADTSSEWVNMAVPLFVASLLYCKKKGGDMCNIESAFKLVIFNTGQDLHDILTSDPEVAMQYNIFMQSMSSENTLGSIKTTFASNLQLFTDPKICMVTMGKGFDPKILRDKPTAIYIVCPEIKSAYVSPLMSVFYMQVLGKLMQYQGNDLPVYALLDEFANNGVINNFSQLAATCRSRKLSLTIGIQGVEQLTQLYGKETGENILNNLKSKIFYPGLAPSSAKIASELCGFTTVDTKSSTKNHHDNVSTSYSVQRRELLSSDEIRRLEDDKVLLVLHNRLPVVDTQNRYYLDKKFIQRLGE